MIKEASSPIVLNGCRTTKIYCRPGCPPGRRTKPENRVHFNSREEARAHGYRACKVCKPDGPEAIPETFFIKYYDSPLGRYVLASSNRGVVCIKPEDQISTRTYPWERGSIRTQDGNGYNDEASGELDAYFAGELRQFSVPLDLRGTDFQLRVWELLRGIPYGETRSYSQIASLMDRPKAGRAVGRANGGNPVSIVVPCHRVIGANGDLVGYGGGLKRKKTLLGLEARVKN